MTILFQNTLTFGALCCATRPSPSGLKDVLPEISEEGLYGFARQLNALEGGGARQELAEIGRETLPVLIDALTDSRPMVRRHAAWALSIIGDPKAIPSLIQALEDFDWEVLEAPDREALYTVFWALKQIPDLRTIEPLLPFVTSDDVEISARALSAMARIYDRFKEELRDLFSKPPYLGLVAIVMRHVNG